MLLVLLPCLCRFIFFPISILFLLFHYCFSNLLIPPPCFLMSAWTFWQSTCVLYPSLYFSSVASVHLHQNISTLLPLPYLWPCFGILHVFSFLSFHTCSLGSNFLCHLFLVLNRMTITNNLCFSTHSSLFSTNAVQTKTLHIGDDVWNYKHMEILRFLSHSTLFTQNVCPF